MFSISSATRYYVHIRIRTGRIAAHLAFRRTTEGQTSPTHCPAPFPSLLVCCCCCCWCWFNICNVHADNMKEQHVSLVACIQQTPHHRLKHKPFGAREIFAHTRVVAHLQHCTCVCVCARPRCSRSCTAIAIDCICTTQPLAAGRIISIIIISAARTCVCLWCGRVRNVRNGGAVCVCVWNLAHACREVYLHFGRGAATRAFSPRATGGVQCITIDVEFG